MKRENSYLFLLFIFFTVAWTGLRASDNQQAVPTFSSAISMAAKIDTLKELIKTARARMTYKSAQLYLMDERQVLSQEGKKWHEFIYQISDENLPLADIQFEIQSNSGNLLTSSVEWKLEIHQSLDNSRDFQFITGGTSENGQIESDIDFLTIDQIKISISEANDKSFKLGDVRGQQTLLSSDYKVMPIGDSITFGKFADDSIGFRKKVYDLMESAGFRPDFVGYNGEKPYEGHFLSGKKIEDFYPRNIGNGNGTGEMDVTNAMNGCRPQMVLIHLGTNDLNGDPYVDVAPYYNGARNNFSRSHSGDMATFINYLLDWHNGKKGLDLEQIVVCSIIPLKNRDSLTVLFNAEIGRLVRDFRNGAITGQPEPVTLCDQYSIFKGNPDLFTRNTNDWMNYKFDPTDKLHPNTVGHNKMGEIYFKTIQQILQPTIRYFENVAWTTETTGTNHYFGNHGIAMADLNNDGIDDIYVGVQDDENPRAPNFFFQSKDSLYTEVARNLAINDPEQTQGAIFVDIDNDGDLDLFIGHYQKQNRLYRNNGNGSFSDVTNSAGIANLARNTLTVLALDIENDGDLDLYAVNSRQQNELYVNNGNGTFTLSDRGANDLDEPNIASPGAAVADMDSDGDADIYIVKKAAPNVLFINDGKGYFSNRATQFGLDDNEGSVAPIFADYDNDGDLDLFLIKGQTGIATTKIKVFRNNANANFTNVSQNYDLVCDGYTSAVADFDNDGDLDLLSVGAFDYARYYENNGTGNFLLRSDQAGAIWGGDARSAATGDFNKDGAPDVYITRNMMLNAQLKNLMAGKKNYLKVYARGPNGNASSFGTKMKLYRQGYAGFRDFLIGYREVTSSLGNESQNSPVQHFGLGDRISVDLMTEFTDGVIRLERGVTANQVIEISPVKSDSNKPPRFISYEDGNHQSGGVGAFLEKPIQAKVTDENGIPVKGVRVDFNVTSGAAELSYCDSPALNMIWKESESGSLSPVVKKVLDHQASDKEFVFVPETASEKGQARLDFGVSNSQTYYLWMRISGRDQMTTSLEVKLDAENFETWSFITTLSWRWERVRINGNNWSRAINNGGHSLTLAIPVAGPFIDRILLTPDAQYTPTGVGAEANTDPMLTDAGGIACRKVKLGSQIGTVVIQATAAYQGVPLTGSPVVFDDLKTTSDVPHRLARISADSLHANGGQPLPAPVQVQCLDLYNNPVPNTPIHFSTDAADGSFSPMPPVITDNFGMATITFILGTKVRYQHVSAFVQNYPLVNPVTFTFIAEGIASKLSYVSGDNQIGTVGEFLSEKAQVKVTTATYEPVEGYPVRFQIIGSGGLVEVQGKTGVIDTVLTDSNGIAAVRWQLGNRVGSDTLQASSANLSSSPITFHAQAGPGLGAILKKISGDSLSASVYLPLVQPNRVRITDKFGNWVPNHPVSFIITRGGGKVSTQEQGIPSDSVRVLTGSDGIASAWWAMGGTTGSWNNELTVSSLSMGSRLQGSPLKFYASAIADSGKYLVKLGEDYQTGRVGEPLPKSFCVRVEDKYRNPVPNYPVSFSVTMGGGSFYGLDSQVVLTGPDGIACATLTPGCSTIKNSQQAKVTASGLEPAFHLFTASAGPGIAHQLTRHSNAHQSARVASALDVPLIVRITDQCQNGIPDHTVYFQRIKGNGSFVGNSTVRTDSNGFANIQYILGTIAGDSTDMLQATASANGNELFGSPMRFWLSTLAGAPNIISDTLGNHQLVFVNQAVPESLGVEVKDRYGNLVPGIEVYFQDSQGKGSFHPDSRRLTGKNGTARVSFVPTAIGNFPVYAQVTHNGQNIYGSPARFDITVTNVVANRLQYVAGNDPIDTVASLLENPFVVKALDGAGKPVSDFNITFTVTNGNGKLENQSVVTKKTDAKGQAEVRLRLGTTAGFQNHIVAASARIGDIELSGSPVIFKASALADIPDAQASRLEAQSPMPANGTASELKVILTDQYGNPIFGRNISFYVSGCPEAILQQPQQPTDSSGVASGYLSSSRACTMTISARIVNTDTWLTQTARVVFINTNASRIVPCGNPQQNGNIGTQLKEPLCVRILASNGLPVSGYPVHFKIHSGSGHFIGDSLIYTRSDGVSQVNFILPDKPDRTIVYANAYGLTDSPVAFTLEAREAVAANIETFSGNVLADTVGRSLSLKIIVTDWQKNPVACATVQFTSLNENTMTVFPPLDTTNFQGVAETSIRLGALAGRHSLKVRAIKNAIEKELVITAWPGKLSNIFIRSGNNQSDTVNHRLPEPLIVKAIDSYDNGIPGVPIDYQVIEGGGKIEPAYGAKTDASGLAAVYFTLGQSLSSNTVVARTSALPGVTLTFREFARADQPDTIIKLSSDPLYGRKNTPLLQPVQVLARDQYKNPVEGTLLTVQILSGAGFVQEGNEILCNKFGIGSFHWNLGDASFSQKVQICVKNDPRLCVLYTAVDTSNAAPRFTSPPWDEISIVENQTLEFSVLAVDPGDEPILYDIQNLPGGASFKEAKFSWKPSYYQAGEYRVTLIASDKYGITAQKPIRIRVQNLNRKPQIVSFTPLPGTIIAFIGQEYTFSVSAVDPDNDTLSFRWYNMIGELLSQDSLFIFKPKSRQEIQNAAQLFIKVFDPEDTVSMSSSPWQIQVKIRLEEFKATVESFKGAKIFWRLNPEEAVHTAGFRLLRGLHSDGPFAEISDLIEPNRRGEYTFYDKNIRAGQDYYYVLEDINLSGEVSRQDPLQVRVALPKELILHQNYPNPFNPTTRIQFELPQPGEIALTVYNLRGEQVYTLAHGKFEAGYHSLTWNGQIQSGTPASSGVYYGVLEAAGNRKTVKMLLLK